MKIKGLAMKKTVLLFCFSISFLGFSQTSPRIISGFISDGDNPMPNVSVSVTGSTKSTFSDSTGRYNLTVNTGDVVSYSHRGMKTFNIMIEDVTRILNVKMVPDVKELGGVTVVGNRLKSQEELKNEYLLRDDIINTAFGYMDAKTAPGRIRVLDEKDIPQIYICVLELLRSRFAGFASMRIVGDCLNGGAVFIRGGSSAFTFGPAIFDIDGVVVTEVPLWLDVSVIKRIAVLGSVSSATRYGSVGSGGVVIINTLSSYPKTETITDTARLRNNFATGKVLSSEEILENSSTYLKELETSSSFAAAKKVFERFEISFSNSPYFYLDAYRHFSEKWNKMGYADGILEENFEQFEDNAVLLKALAYIYEAQGRLEKANEMYKETFILRPSYAQSYRDMANSYSNLDKTKKAASMYARYYHLLQEGFMELDSIGFAPILRQEVDNLLLTNNTLPGYKKKRNRAGKKLKQTRLVFEWNDGEAEFELQFVNPDNQYYKWKHTLADNSEIIQREKEYGYSVMEQVIDDNFPGLWRVNVNYFGNKSLTPTYLKATVYHNFGTDLQQKETMAFKLSLKNVNQELFTVQISENNATR